MLKKQRRLKTGVIIGLISLALFSSGQAAELANGGKAKNQIVFGMTWEPSGFYPIRAIDAGSYCAQTLVYEGLVKYDAQIKIIPGLAEAYTIS